MERSLQFSIGLLAMVILQTSDCGPPPTGNTQLSLLEFDASGQNRIVGFSSNDLSYDVWAPAGDSVVTVRAQSVDPGSDIKVHYQGSIFPIGVGSGEVDITVSPGLSSMVVFVRAPEGAGKGYVLDVTHGAAPPAISTDIDVGYNDSAFQQHSIVSATLTVAPGALAANSPFTAELSGTLMYPESLLDAGQTLALSCQQTDVIGAQLTVLVRTGATGAPVVLSPDLSGHPSTCLINGACDTANNVPGNGNTDCVPQGSFNPCQTLFTIPTSTDLATCQSLDGPDCTPPSPLFEECRKVWQLTYLGFCVTGPLAIPLLAQTGQYVAGAAGETIRFGIDDQNTAATLSGGLYTMPVPGFADPLGPNAMKVDTCGALAHLEGVMAVEVGDPLTDPVDLGVTPDSFLVGEGVYLIP